MPRYAGYVLKGLRNGVLAQTLQALPAAIRLSSGIPVRRPSAFARDYLWRHDRAYRGSPLTRLGSEVLGRLPG